jgi:uncharacterized protein
MRCLWIAISVLLGAPPTTVLAGEPPVHACDRLAASVPDPRKLVPGVLFSELVPEPAIVACRSAVGESPGVARFELHLARALHKGHRFDEARTFYERAAAKCEAIAMFNLGVIYYSREGGDLPEDSEAAGLRWIERSAALGQSEAIYLLRRLRGETTVKRAGEDSHCLAAS